MVRAIVALVLALVTTELAAPQRLPESRYAEDVCLAWVVHDEARGEPLKGQRAVLDVVLKRMKKSGKTACQVVKKKKQFSGYTKGMLLRVNHEQFKRLQQLRKMKPVVPEATHFHAEAVAPSWARNMIKCGKVGRHVFWKEKNDRRLQDRR